MDFIAHILWSFIIFHGSWDLLRIGLAVFFGILPDLALTPIFFKFVFNRDKFDRKRFIKQTPDYVFKLYNSTHSIIVFLIFFIPALIIFGEPALLMTAWLIHVLVDIPTHEKNFFGTKFLYPLSDYSINGFSWANKWFLIVNYTLIIFFIVLILYGIV